MSDVGSDFEDDNHFTFRAKWMLDGCSNLEDVINRLEEEIEYIKQLQDDGWELIGTIEDDWGFLRRSDQTIPPSTSPAQTPPTQPNIV